MRLEPNRKSSNSRLIQLYWQKGLVSVVQLAIAAAVLALIPVSVYLARQQQKIQSQAATSAVKIYFDPANSNIIGESYVKVRMETGASRLGFARVDFTFDHTKVNLSKEITTSNLMNSKVRVTTAANANTSGKVTVVLGVDPEDHVSNPNFPWPVGTFDFAEFAFVPVTTQVNTQSALMFDTSLMEVVGYSPNQELPFEVTNGNIGLNITPTTTAVPSISPSLSPKPSITPSVVISVTPSLKPSAAPSLTPKPSITPSPTALPINTPVPTVTLPPVPTVTPETGEIQAVFQVTAANGDVNEDGQGYTEAGELWIGTGAAVEQSWMGVRFTNVQIPRRSVIKNARLQVYSDRGQWININARLLAQASDNSEPFSLSAKPSQRLLTANFVPHSSSSIWQPGSWYEFENMAAIIQEVVNRSGWKAGNSLTVLVKGGGQAWGRKFIASYNSDPVHAPKLIIDFTAGSVIEPTDIPGPTNKPPVVTPTYKPRPPISPCYWWPPFLRWFSFCRP